MYKIKEEIKERFGDVPLSTQNLLLISYIKSVARKIKITSIIQNGKNIRIQFKDDSMINAKVISSILHKYGGKITFNATEEPYFIYRVSTMDQYKMLMELKDILENFIYHSVEQKEQSICSIQNKTSVQPPYSLKNGSTIV